MAAREGGERGGVRHPESWRRIGKNQSAVNRKVTGGYSLLAAADFPVMFRMKAVVLRFLLVLCAFVPVSAGVKMPGVFSDGMVLQRGIPLPVWGEAKPGEKILVTFRRQKKETVAGADGRWQVKLEPEQAGGPDVLRVSGAGTMEIRDVLVGEVWFGSGQSNMAFGLRAFRSDAPLQAAAKAGPYPQVRLLHAGKKWMPCTPENLENFSAQLFYFGLQLQKELGVPVGLIVGAHSGTASGRWLTPEMFQAWTACVEAAARVDAAFTPEAAMAAHEKALAKWEKDVQVAKKKGKKEPRKPGFPRPPAENRKRTIGDLYRRYVAPVATYGIRGVLWDQGEAGTSLEGINQHHVMGALIAGWRKAWGQGDFPFIYVQKPSGGGCAWNPSDPVTRMASAFAKLPDKVPAPADNLDDYLLTMRYPSTAMVISSDLGGGIHPYNKSGYATRGARVALALAYGKPGPVYGPSYQSHVIEGNNIRVRFVNTGGGLAWRHSEKLQGFALAGKDGAFHWADARIDGDTVVLASRAVAAPVAVRYAWAHPRAWANLFNKDGLPAIPFRAGP
jgi:sialate O-acetylesterase